MSHGAPARFNGAAGSSAGHRGCEDAQLWGSSGSVAVARALRIGRGEASEHADREARCAGAARRWGRLSEDYLDPEAGRWQRALARAVTDDDACVGLAAWLVCAALLSLPRAERAASVAALPGPLGRQVPRQFRALREDPTLLARAKACSEAAAPALAAAVGSMGARAGSVAVLASCLGADWTQEFVALDPTLTAWPWCLAIEADEARSELIAWWCDAVALEAG